MTDRRSRWRGAAATVGAVGLALTALGCVDSTPAARGDAAPALLGWLHLAPVLPPLASLPRGPLLQRAQARGELVVGVRSYPRPAPPGSPRPSEPDAFDAALAQRLADSLGLPLRLVGLAPEEREDALRDGRVDLLVAGAAANAAASDAQRGIAAAAGDYDGGDARVVALRHGRLQDAAALRGASVCVGEGSGYAAAVAQRYGAEPHAYPSSVHAASAFMAGECEALVEDEAVLARLMQNPEWRFYRPLASHVAAGADATVRLAAGDAVSRDYLAAALRHWRDDGAQALARNARAADLQFEITQLKDGWICHG